MLNGALFAIIEEAGTAVMILGEEVEREEFLASCLTRGEVRRQLLAIANAAASVPAATRQMMPELEWAGWDRLGRALHQGLAEEDEALWFGLRSLAPATLMWLQVYRKNRPELFAFTA